MRESVGATILIQIVMIFIVLYVSIFAIAINYSITFRVKNQIITLIEEYGGFNNASDAIDEYISSIGYYKANTMSMNNNDTCASSHKKPGYNICEIVKDDGKDAVTKTYYRVTAYVSFDFPLLGRLLNFPVAGETRIMYDVE